MSKEANIEIENILRESGVKTEAIEEILRLSSEKNNLLQESKEKTNREIIKNKLMDVDEKDWRKRASLAARLISESLE